MPAQSVRFPRLAASVALAAALVSACTPVVRRHGYVPETESLDEIVPQQDSKSSVLARFGNPSTRGVFDEETWYYVTDLRQRLGYLKPESAARSITAVRFDENGVVASIAKYDLEDGRVVNYAARETPTRGRELTVLEQLLGNVGALPTEAFSDQDNLPGGAGGPRR